MSEQQPPLPQAPPPEPSTEQHLYSMPDDCEMFLAALTALQDYSFWLNRRAVSVEATVHCPNPQLKVLIPCIERPDDKVKVVSVIDSLEGVTSEKFEHAVQFDPAIAYKLSRTTEKHAVQMMGIQVGSDSVKVLPDISAIMGNYRIESDVLILPFPGADAVYEFLANNKPELAIERVAGSWGWTLAMKAHLVVGVRSGVTYLAASAGRGVVEIYPTDCHRNWLSKWANPRYQMIYGNPGDVQPALVYRAIEAVWKKVEQQQRALAVQSA